MAEAAPARAGAVYLAGWGPGEPLLATVRARGLVAAADLVVLPEAIQGGVRPWMADDAAGLSSQEPHLLDRIAEAVAQDRIVVWLTQGDPIVDGQGGEILKTLHDRGLAVEVVPGLPLSVAAAPAVQASLAGRPLHGKRVLVTRPPHQAAEMVEWLVEAGAEPVLCPTIRIERVAEMDEIDKAMDELGRHAWVIFTSVNGVDCFFRRLQERGLDLRAFAGARVAAIGSATAGRLSRHGLRTDLVPERFQAEGLLDRLSHEDLQGKRILIPRAETARDVLPDTLRQRGAVVQVLVVYRAVSPAGLPEKVSRELSAGSIHAVTFTSSSTVSRFQKLMEPASAAQLLSEAGVAVACIGPVTGKTARDLGFNVTVEAEPFTVPDLVAALCRHFAGTS
jgi:uroporphyrinogen-III synthase